MMDLGKLRAEWDALIERFDVLFADGDLAGCQSNLARRREIAHAVVYAISNGSFAVH